MGLTTFVGNRRFPEEYGPERAESERLGAIGACII